MDPLKFAARITSSFALSSLKSQSTVLDAGCGGGAIAASMQKGGLKVMAIDSNSQAIAKTEGLGIACRLSDLQTFEHEAFDAVLCSASLHHMDPLDAALNAASRLLKQDGVLLVEDFGYERVDLKTAVWLFNLAQFVIGPTNEKTEKAKVGTEKAAKHGHGRWLLSERKSADRAAEAMAIWRQHNEIDHHVISFERVKNALLDRFEIVSEQNVPYLFRYLCDLLPATKFGAEQAAQIYQWEKEQAESGGIEMCGARIIARKKF